MEPGGTIQDGNAHGGGNSVSQSSGGITENETMNDMRLECGTMSNNGGNNHVMNQGGMIHGGNGIDGEAGGNNGDGGTCKVRKEWCSVHNCKAKSLKVSSKKWRFKKLTNTWGFVTVKTTKILCSSKIEGPAVPRNDPISECIAVQRVEGYQISCGVETRGQSSNIEK